MQALAQLPGGKYIFQLNDYREEIHKCSKCGLCQSVCPVYKVTGNDCSVSRGKFIMLNGIIKGDLKLNKNVNKYLDMCLKCNACKDFCPSGIDARKIFLTAKAEYFDKSRNSKFIRILNSATAFNFFMNCTKFATNIYRILKLDKILKLFYLILLKMGELGKGVILVNEFVSMPSRHAELVSASNQHAVIEQIPKRVRDDKLIKIVYFKGCVNEYINPRTKIAAEKILKNIGVEIIPVKFQCCGVPFLSSGNVEQFKKQAEFNLSQIPDDIDYFLTDCASCQNAFKEYGNYFDNENLLEKLKKINQKSMNVVDFIMKNTQGFEFNKKTSFTFHKPCHLEDMKFLKDFLKKAKNIEYIEMNEFDKCCGFSGEFAVKNPKISPKISANKAKNIIETKADYILTACPSCILGLTQGLIEERKISDYSPLNIVEFIAKADKFC